MYRRRQVDRCSYVGTVTPVHLLPTYLPCFLLICSAVHLCQPLVKENVIFAATRRLTGDRPFCPSRDFRPCSHYTVLISLLRIAKPRDRNRE